MHSNVQRDKNSCGTNLCDPRLTCIICINESHTEICRFMVFDDIISISSIDNSLVSHLIFVQKYNKLFCLAKCEYTLYYCSFPSYQLLAHRWSISQIASFDIPLLPPPARCLLQRASVYPSLYHLQKLMLHVCIFTSFDCHYIFTAKLLALHGLQ